MSCIAAGDLHVANIASTVIALFLLLHIQALGYWERLSITVQPNFVRCLLLILVPTVPQAYGWHLWRLVESGSRNDSSVWLVGRTVQHPATPG